MKTILFATDFSENARHALTYAIAFTQQINGQLVLFHAYQPADPFVEVPPYILVEQSRMLKEQAVVKLKALLSEIHHQAPDISATFMLRQGSFIPEILEFLKREQVDFLVMGTMGVSGLSKALMGSNTARIMAKASCPVLAIPPNCTFTSLDTIVYATNYRDEDEGILRRLAELANFFDSRIVMLYVSTNPEEVLAEVYEWYRQALTEIIPNKQVAFRVVNSLDVQEGISLGVDDINPDMVVMSMRKKNWLDRLINGSETRKRVHYTHKPLLIFHLETHEMEEVVRS